MKSEHCNAPSVDRVHRAAWIWHVNQSHQVGGSQKLRAGLQGTQEQRQNPETETSADTEWVVKLTQMSDYIWLTWRTNGGEARVKASLKHNTQTQERDLGSRHVTRWLQRAGSREVLCV